MLPGTIISINTNMKTLLDGWRASSNYSPCGEAPCWSSSTMISSSSFSSTTSSNSSIVMSSVKISINERCLRFSVFTPAETWIKFHSHFSSVFTFNRWLTIVNNVTNIFLRQSQNIFAGGVAMVEHVSNSSVSRQNCPQTHQLLSWKGEQHPASGKIWYLFIFCIAGTFSKEFKTDGDEICQLVHNSCLQTRLKEGRILLWEILCCHQIEPAALLTWNRFVKQ